ncbi:MAG TPA: isoprenylcysteine carboxylmethyltransferase family protein [Aggregatilineaceae bacterium]|nr:isoprenylcysteine carboxylmethyltransferase family protein [Aggregatilineaceae bacterium]
MKYPAWWKNSRGEWYVIVQVFLFALIAAGPILAGDQPDVSGFVRAVALVIGGLFGAVGLLLVLAGLWGLGDNLSPLPHPKDDATLVQTGVFGIVRHPIYSGLITGAVGWALLNVSLVTLVFALVLLVFFDIKSRREERYLAAKFPEYAAYQRRVRKLIPWVY